MKCPVCQAKLLPVDGELFCLQCGNSVALTPGTEQAAAAGAPTLEETVDPVLQRAIVDAVHHAVQFKLPVSAAAPAQPVASFAPMRAILAAPRPVLAGVSGGLPAERAPSTTGAAATAARGAAVTAAVVGAPAAVVPAVVPASLIPVMGGKNVADATTSAAKGTRKLGAMGVAWGIGVAAFILFVGVNVALYGYYSTRVYPGVKAGSVSLGGTGFADLHAKLVAAAPHSKLAVDIGEASYSVDSDKVGAVDIERIEREVKEMGHSTPLPLAGVARAWLSGPIGFHYAVDDAALKTEVAAIAQQVDRPAADAVPVVLNGTAFVISEKPGLKLDANKLAGLIAQSLGNTARIAIEPAKVAPLVTAGSLRADVDGAQARLGLVLQVKVKTATYTVSSQEISGWLVVGSPGSGVVVDGARVGN
jgi:hypothetical protein